LVESAALFFKNLLADAISPDVPFRGIVACGSPAAAENAVSQMKFVKTSSKNARIKPEPFFINIM